MPYITDVIRFLYGRFWYGDPFREIHGLDENQLYWIPETNALPIIWHVGHIAHRERFHIGVFLKGLTSDIIPDEMQVFGTDWAPVEEIRAAASLEDVLTWVREVRKESLRFVNNLTPADLEMVIPDAGDQLSTGHWLFITVAHTALHIGRIQLLRALIEGTEERAC
jgi:hypothetical protein